MTSIDASEAEKQFCRLVERAERGERIVITRQGVPVAVLQPPDRTEKESPEAVIARLKSFCCGRRLGDLTIRELIEEGRR